MGENKRQNDKLIIELCKKFEQHVILFEQHVLDDVNKFDKLIEAQQLNADAVSKLTDSVASLVNDTSSIIQLQKDFQGAARVGKGLQNFMLWMLKWGVIGTGVVAIIKFVIDYFNN